MLRHFSALLIPCWSGFLSYQHPQIKILSTSCPKHSVNSIYSIQLIPYEVNINIYSPMKWQANFSKELIKIIPAYESFIEAISQASASILSHYSFNKSLYCFFPLKNVQHTIVALSPPCSERSLCHQIQNFQNLIVSSLGN